MEKPESIFRKYLAARAVSMTEAHGAICRAVFEIHDHFTLEELGDKLISRVNGKQMFDILNQLVGAGLVRKVIFREDQVFYEHVYGHVHHDHLVCISCGKIIEFTHPAIEISQEEVTQKHGFKMLRHSLRIAGLCAACREKTDATQVAPAPEQRRQPEMPLSMVNNGEHVIVGSIRGGKQMLQRLASMGITQGDEIEVIQNTFTGPITVRARDSRIAIGHGMSHKIFVKLIT